MAPGCVQVPQVPITIAANGDGALRVAARYADGWNTWGEASSFPSRSSSKQR